MDKKYKLNLTSQRDEEPEKKVLYVVGTPIGNLNDISLRAKNILKNVSLIACEDTRVTRKLLNYLKIKNKLFSFYEHNSQSKITKILDLLKEGNSIALVSDAGMPTISDPGENLISQARKNNIDVICVPGPFAGLNALISSGLSTSSFSFYGFLPNQKKARLKLLDDISKNQCTSIIYESPRRIKSLVQELINVCGKDRKISISKELTKKYEQHFSGNLRDMYSVFKDIELKGEYTIILDGQKDEIVKVTNKDLIEDLNALIDAGLTHSSASHYLSNKYKIPKNKIYNLLLE